MSGNANSSNGSSQSQSQSQSAYDPQVLAKQMQGVQNAQDYVSNNPYQAYSGAPLTFDNGGVKALTNYQAPTTTGYGYQAASMGAVPTVTAGQLSSTNLSPYMNPYTSNVIDTTNAQLARQNQIDNTTAAGQATAAGAFGGSRSAVLQNLNTDSYQRNLGQTDAGLNASNFTQAQGAAEQDIASRLQASEANQGTGLAVAQGNQNATNTANQFGAAAQNTAGLANQSANLAGAQTQLSAQNLSAQNAQALYGANWQQYLNSQQVPLALQNYLTSAYGLLPSSPLSTSSGTASGNNNSSGFGFGLPLPT